MKKWFLITLLVATVGTVMLELMSYFIGTEIVFVSCVVIVFIYGAIVVPYKQFRKSYKQAKIEDSYKAYSVERYVVYARNQAEAEEKVQKIKNSFEQRKAERKKLELSKTLSN